MTYFPLLQYTFALKSEVATKKGSKVLVEKMDLAFDENEDAVRWRQALAEQVQPSLLGHVPSYPPHKTQAEMHLKIGSMPLLAGLPIPFKIRLQEACTDAHADPLDVSPCCLLITSLLLRRSMQRQK